MIEEHKITTTVQDVLDDMEEGVSYIIDINIDMNIYFQIFYNSGIMYHCNHHRDDGRCTQSEFDNLMKMSVKHITYVEVTDLDSSGEIKKTEASYNRCWRYGFSCKALLGRAKVCPFNFFSLCYIVSRKSIFL